MITVSLETATKLHEAGRGKLGTGYTKFSYRPYHSDEVQLINQFHPFLHYCVIHGENFFYAPTAEEILDRLSKKIQGTGSFGKFLYYSFYIETRKYADCDEYYFICGYDGKPFFVGYTLVEALAKLRIWCKENNFLPEQK